MPLTDRITRAALIRFLKFCIVGASGVVVNAGLFYLLTAKASMHYSLAAVVAIECAIINNFIWNYLWTFGDRRAGGTTGVMAAFFRFNVSCGLVALFVNLGVDVLLVETLGSAFEEASSQWVLLLQAVHISGIIAGTVVNYVVSHIWTFKSTQTNAAL